MTTKSFPGNNPKIEMQSVGSLRAYPNNARRHSKRQVRQIAESIRRFGFTNPVLVSDEGEIIAGHGRVEAAKALGMGEVPTLALSHLSAAERRAYVLADNKLALNAGWDAEVLAIELQGLIDLEFDVSVTGFSLAEVDLVLDAADDRKETPGRIGAEDRIPPVPGEAVTRRGDLWALGKHRLICGDAREDRDYATLLGDEKVDLVFTDPPYNVRIDGNVCGLGEVRHREFAFASGEMSSAEFTGFLTSTLTNMAGACRDGAIAFVCMDWRHMREMLDAGAAAFTELKNLCVWNKTNGGMGSFYRSKHELVFVFKVGTLEHTNTFGLGDTGRYRTNVWDYAGISSIGSTRAEELAMHPTVKPVALVADAIKDCTKRGEIVLDGFGGSGTTLIAAETCGRKARLIEYDPVYCDTIITRWETLTGKAATLLGERRVSDDPAPPGESAAAAVPVSTGRTFEDVAEQRLGPDWASSGSRRGAVEPGLRKEVRTRAGSRKSRARAIAKKRARRGGNLPHGNGPGGLRPWCPARTRAPGGAALPRGNGSLRELRPAVLARARDEQGLPHANSQVERSVIRRVFGGWRVAAGPFRNMSFRALVDHKEFCTASSEVSADHTERRSARQDAAG